MYPSLSPYAFGADNPIYFVDKNGKWLGTTFIYSESSGGVGIGFGLYRVEQAGIARDKVGRTHFIISTSIHVNNQNSYDGSSHPNIAVGGDATIISASIKQDWSASTYLESVGVSAIEFKSPFAINTKLQLETPSLKLGIGVTGSFSKNSATIGIALGGGFTFNIIDKSDYFYLYSTSTSSYNPRKFLSVFNFYWNILSVCIHIMIITIINRF